jgi:long-chain acyl-CoA synthetase
VASGGPLLKGYFRAALAISAWTGGRFGTTLFAKVHASFGGHLRRIVAGGSALEPRLGKNYQLLGIKVAEGYGMTETSPVLTVNPWDAIRFGAVGKAIPGVEVQLRRIEGGADSGGEIWVRGANVMSGYYCNPEATAAVLQGGWLCTGDIGRFDTDGYLSISGRTKDVIVTDAGKNVYPEEVELRYRDLPGVREMVVVGVPGAGRGERVCAIIAPQPPATEGQIEEIRAAIAARAEAVPSYQQITQIEIWCGDLPKTTTLKVKRGKLRDALLAGQRGDGRVPAPPAAVPLPQPAFSKEETWVIETLARLTRSRPDTIRPNSRLADLGVDSLTKVELVGELEARLGFRVNDAIAGSLNRVQDLLDLARTAT